MNAPTLRYDPDADAAYLKMSDLPHSSTVEYADWLMVDYATDGTPIGVEILNAGHEGVLLEEALLEDAERDRQLVREWDETLPRTPE